MVSQELVKQRLYDKYIEPTKQKRKDYIGIEIEMPILNLERKAVDFENIHKITHKFIEKYSFEPVNIDDDGNIIAAREEHTGDILSYDCSYNNLELSFGKSKTLDEVYDRFCVY